MQLPGKSTGLLLALAAAWLPFTLARAQTDATARGLAGLTVSENLRPAKAALVQIDQCRGQLPGGELKQRFTRAEESLIEGLLIGWNPAWKKKWPSPHYVALDVALDELKQPRLTALPTLTPPPEAYLRSLRNDATVCTVVTTSQPASAEAILEGIVRDLEVKFRDCYLHGMGRLVPVEVATKRGQSPEPGWTVYFKWVTVSDLPTSETPFRTSSTPARDDLPPGVYQLRAEKKGSASVQNSESKTVDLSGEHSQCELQVP